MILWLVDRDDVFGRHRFPFKFKWLGANGVFGRDSIGKTETFIFIRATQMF